MNSVSVIIPVYNNVGTVERAIASAVEGGGSEIIVIDDGSTDGSRDLLAKFGEKITLILQENAGACAARNRGIAHSTCEFIKFLDADDVLHRDCLSRQLARAVCEDSRTIVFGIGRWVDTSGNVVGQYPSRVMEDGEFLTLSEITLGSPLTSCPLHRRECLEAVGGFNTNCLRGQEHDLHVRLGIQGVRFRYFADLCYDYHQSGHSNRISANRYRLEVCKNVFDVYLAQEGLARINGIFEAHPSVRLAFAKRFWRHGRMCLRASHHALASKCFEKSESLGCSIFETIDGSAVYKMLVRAVGPFIAEWVNCVNATSWFKQWAERR